MALHPLPCQAPGVIGSVLGLVGPVSVYCDWVRWDSLIRNFYLSVAACRIVSADPSLRYSAGTLSSQQTPNAWTAPVSKGRYHGGQRPSSDDIFHGTFADGGNASCYSACRVPMVEWRLDCNNCRHLTVVVLHDSGPRLGEGVRGIHSCLSTGDFSVGASVAAVPGGWCRHVRAGTG